MCEKQFRLIENKKKILTDQPNGVESSLEI